MLSEGRGGGRSLETVRLVRDLSTLSIDQTPVHV